MGTMKKHARVAGLLFLLMVVTGLFAELFFRQKLVTADAATTAKNILNNAPLLRAGVLSDIVMALSYLFTALALDRLLRPVDRELSMRMVLFARGCMKNKIRVSAFARTLYKSQIIT